MSSNTKEKFVVVNPPLGVDVIFWGVDMSDAELKKDEGDKVKICQIHTGTRPWVICADRDDEIHVWDYSSKKRLMRKYLQDMTSAKFNRDSSIEASKVRPFVEQRIPQFQEATNRWSHYSTYLQEGFVDNFTQEILGFDSHFMCEEDLLGNSNSENTLSGLKQFGTIRAVAFVDEQSIQNNSGERFSPHIATFNVDTRVMIVCDSALIFYDFATNKSNTISSSDLSGKAITTAEFVFSDLVAIGCSDGLIRIWDCQKWIEVKVLAAHSRGEIVALKNLPILR